MCEYSWKTNLQKQLKSVENMVRKNISPAFFMLTIHLHRDVLLKSF